MNDFLTALALVLVIEGMIYVVMPGTMQRLAKRLLVLPGDRLRLLGVLLVAVGVALVWVIRGTGMP